MERVAGGIHENNLGLVSVGVVVDSKDEVSSGVEDGESIATEEQGFLPHGEDGGGLCN